MTKVSYTNACSKYFKGSLNKSELEKLKEAHFKRIELSDAIYVINKNNYIGDSTKIEIDYAKKLKKEIMYLEKI